MRRYREVEAEEGRVFTREEIWAVKVVSGETSVAGIPIDSSSSPSEVSHCLSARCG
jgi:hypothetical protein